MKIVFLFVLLLAIQNSCYSAVVSVVNTNDSGTGSLRNAVSIANSNDTIKMNSSLLLNGTAVINLFSTISITKPLVIKGVYSTTDTLFISGQNTFQIFKVILPDSIDSFTVDSLCFVDGISAAYATGGGAIFFQGHNLNVSNCYFANNFAFQGGAIRFEHSLNAGNYKANFKGSYFNKNYSTAGGNAISYNTTTSNSIPENHVLIEDCTFDDNSTTTGNLGVFASLISGPAIINVKTSKFTNNSGSSIFLRSHSTFGPDPVKELHIDSSEFLFNFGSAGAAVNAFSCDTITVDNSSFIDNYVNAYGGAMYCYGERQYLDIDNCYFIDNKADTTSVSTPGSGGAIDCRSAVHTDVFVRSSLFKGNRTLGNGGAIYAFTYAGNSANVLIDHSVLDSNTAGHSGGAVSLSARDGSFSNAKIVNSTFKNNIATTGGAINSNSQWNNGSNRAKSTVNISKSTFFNNYASSNGGAIGSYSSSGSSYSGGSYVTADESTFTNNSAGLSGGAIHNYLYTQVPTQHSKRAETTINNSTFYHNLSSDSSGINNVSNIFPAKVRTTSSIIFNGGIKNFYNSSTPYQINSGGYNIFSDSIVAGSGLTDSLSIDSVVLALTPLAFNGGDTQTMLPDSGSIAFNAGNPVDFGAAQNWIISDGARDIGAAELGCVDTVFVDLFECDSLVSNAGYSYKNSGSYIDTIPSATGCDTLLFIELTIGNSFRDDTIDICRGGDFICPDGYGFYGIMQNSSHQSILMSSTGCDSIINTNLVVLPTFNLISNDTVCIGGFYEFPDGTIYQNIIQDTSHTSNLSTINGCDSIITVFVHCYSIVGQDLTTSLLVTEITSNATNATFQWLDCLDNFEPIIGAVGQSYTATTDGEFAVEITKNGCRDTSDCTIISFTGLDDFNLEYIEIFPNPATNYLNVACQLNDFKVIILDLNGKIIHQSYNNFEISRIELKDLAGGIYMVSIENSSGQLIKTSRLTIFR
ncbi:MAG: T9SS type A sorting domain-containing protein [Crocinitomicaceae bacterium]